MMQTQQSDVAEQLRNAVLQGAIDSGVAAAEGEKRGQNGKGGAVSPLNGAPTPPGRPKGVRNRLTALRDSILDAYDQVGGTEYLAKLAQGTQSDRAAFIGLVKHVLPATIDANVSGGVQVQLSWLGGRQIGTTAAQAADVVTQVVDLEKDSSGKYRIIDPKAQPEPAPAAADPALDPHPPIDRQAGGQL